MAFARLIGLMSGTSLDGVDVALIETDGEDIGALGATAFRPYAPAEREVLRAALIEARGLADRATRPPALAAAEALITRAHAEAVEAFLKEHCIARAGITAIGFHGQTVLHRPESRLTVQIGDGPALAHALRIPVVYDFRAADVAAGGQGAPLVPVFHRALVARAALKRPVALVNIGGVSNLTYIDDPAEPPIACDTGPGNALVDDFMLARTGVPMDRDGAAAAGGRVHADTLAALMAHPFFGQPAPKSLDRNAWDVSSIAALSTEDGAATLTAFTASAIAAIRPHLPKAPASWIIAGGGARNPTLLRMLAEKLGHPILTSDAVGWSSSALEAQAFAFLAARTLRGLALTFPTTTGAPRPLAGGVVARP